MSKWSSLGRKHDAFGDGSEAVTIPTSCRYLVHITPPVDGSARPASAPDIATITLPRVTKAPDTTHKLVLWYEVLVRTMGHQWSVLKRFSEFLELGEEMERVGLTRLVKHQLSNSFTPPPSRLSLTHWRQERLEVFMRSLLQTLKDLSIVVATEGGGGGGGVEEGNRLGSSLDQVMEVTRAAFSSFICFLTTSSLEGVPTSLGDMPCVSDNTWFYSPRVGDCDLPPPTKVVHIAERRFVIMMQLPGAIMSSLSIVATENTREITVGGCWNSHITGVSSVFTGVEETVQSSTCSMEDTARSSRSCGLEGAGSAVVLVDTFPIGGFQTSFEVPLPFSVDDWCSEYAAGVLFLTWSSNAETPQNSPVDDAYP